MTENLCTSCLGKMSIPTFCIICGDTYCDECRTGFMCKICYYKEELSAKDQELTIRLRPILTALRNRVQPEDYKMVKSLVSAWRNGIISQADQYLANLSQRLKPTTIRFIKQVELILCDQNYIVDDSYLEPELVKSPTNSGTLVTGGGSSIGSFRIKT